MSNDEIELFDSNSDCCGCGACADSCPRNAIIMVEDYGLFPLIDYNSCIKCSRCVSVCGLKNKFDSEFPKKAYIGKGLEKEYSEISASGGVFSAIAKQFLISAGVVYGATLAIRNGICECKHIRVEALRDLHLILNSKYVQSRTAGVFKEVQKDLQQGKRVLFSGTSCQVASLKAYLGKNYKDNGNLFTIDLICHGVPPIGLLQSYIDFVQGRENGRVISLSFRNKDRSLGRNTPYIMSFDIESEEGKKRIISSLRESSYYRLFMNMAGYCQSCYNCRFSSVDKPSDLTLGDYYPTESRSEVLKKLMLDKDEYYSCVIRHSLKGDYLLSSTNLKLHVIPLGDAVRDHSNLQHSSFPSNEGKKMWRIYLKKGFRGLQRYIDTKNMFVDFVKMIKGTGR